MGGVTDFRAAASALMSRFSWARQMGLTFNGARNVPGVLGYREPGGITTQDFIERYERGGIAGRVIDVPPNATWRGELWLEENEDPDVVTPFEKAWEDLEKQFALREQFLRVDKLSRLSTYAVLLIGAPGEWDTELPKGKPEDLLYFQPYLGGGGPATNRQRSSSGMFDADSSIASYDEDPTSKRFGQPQTYNLKRIDFSSPSLGRPIHWTRIIHVAEGLLRDEVFGQPALERCWNYFDDMDKVVGGGSEAFWLRANQGLHLNVDKDMVIAKGDATSELQKMRDEAEEYQHQLTRMIRTRGVDVNTLGSDVANFSTPADTIITLIAGSTGIPKRLLVGSEQGELASTQDRENFRDLVSGRQTNHAAPRIVRPLVDRLIEYGYLPKPKEYKVKWPNIEVMSETEKTAGGQAWAATNQAQGEVVFTSDEIRDKWAGLKPLTPEQQKAEEEKQAKKAEAEVEKAGATAKATAVLDPNKAIAAKGKKKFPRAAEEANEEMIRVLEVAIETGATDVVAEITGLEEFRAAWPNTDGFDDHGRGEGNTPFNIPSGWVEEGLNTEHPDVAEQIQRYTHNNDVQGLHSAMLLDDYKAYENDLQLLLKQVYKDKPILVTRKENYAGGDGRGAGIFASVSTNPTWKGTRFFIARQNVAFAGNESEGELIVHRGGLRIAGGPGSGNHGHSGRPGEIGGSAPKAAPDYAASQRRQTELKAEWSRLNDELFKHIDNPTSPEAKDLVAKQKAVFKEMHRLEADPGGIEGIQRPGGPRDVVVIGAGPGGYASAVMGGAEGLDTLLVEAQPEGGGQSSKSSRIENLPGYPVGVTGEKLAADMKEQSERMGAELNYGVSATGIDYDATTGMKTVHLSDGRSIQSRSVVIAGGVQFSRGNFEGSEGPSVIYGDSKKLASAGAGKNVVVAGGSNGAAQAALLAAQHADHVTIVSRKTIDASMSDYQVSALRAHPKITVLEGEEIKAHKDGVMTLNSGKQVQAQAVGVFFGGRPQTEWVPSMIRRDRHGKLITNSRLETDIPGVFAVGDVRTGSIGRIGMAIGEGQLATSEIFQYFETLKAQAGVAQ